MRRALEWKGGNTLRYACAEVLMRTCFRPFLVLTLTSQLTVQVAVAIRMDSKHNQTMLPNHIRNTRARELDYHTRDVDCHEQTKTMRCR